MIWTLYYQKGNQKVNLVMTTIYQIKEILSSDKNLFHLVYKFYYQLF